MTSVGVVVVKSLGLDLYRTLFFFCDLDHKVGT
uniref:Uncharacterized protein n=1 Tax=Rhizophora mucronata TaxID=61149 RepID=A0A2P2NF46_RHIMU